MFEALLNEPQLRCLGMSEYDQVGNRISESTFEYIRDILQETKENLGTATIDTIIREIEEARVVSLTIVAPEKPSSIRNELQELQDSTHKLLKAIERTSEHTEWALWRAAHLDSSDNELLDFDSNKGPGYRLFRLKKNVQVVNKAAELATKNESDPGRRPPNIIARHLAFHVLVALEQQAVKCTSYDDGTYFKILEAVFADVLPEQGPGSYTRPGKWALKTPVLDMESMLVDPSILGT